MKKETKTNVQRILETAGIAHRVLHYECDSFVDGLATAHALQLDTERVFKTLVATGKSGAHYVFIIPVEEELDLKRAAAAAGEKTMEMLALRELTPLTGYVRGGCTAVGMKKSCPVFMDEMAQLWDTIYVSAGRIGTQLEVAPSDWLSLTGGAWARLTKE